MMTQKQGESHFLEANLNKENKEYVQEMPTVLGWKGRYKIKLEAQWHLSEWSFFNFMIF